MIRKLNYAQDWDKYFTYDETSPSCLRWNITKGVGNNRVEVGDVAGHLSQRNRWLVGLHGKVYSISCVIFSMHFELDEKLIVDHMDHNGRNNKISNLRQVDQRTNCKNKVRQSNNTSGVTGVSYHKRDQYWSCSWMIGDKLQQKRFYVKHHGESAMQMAIDCRKEIESTLLIPQLNYTETHGKDLNVH